MGTPAGAPAYLVKNNIVDSAGITSSSADSVYVSAFLIDQDMAKPFRWDETISTGVTLFVELDFGVSKAADTLAILNHNFPSDTTFELKTGAAASPTTVTATPVWREGDIWISFTDPTARFYRLEVTMGTVPAGSPNPEIGELYIGLRTELTFHMAFGMARGVEQKKIEQQTQRGVRWHFDLVNRRFFDAPFRSIKDAHITELDTLDRSVNGEATPFIWIPNKDLTDVYMVRKVGDHRKGNLRNGEWNVDLRLEEEARGVALTNSAVVQLVTSLTFAECADDWVVVASGTSAGAYGAYVELIAATTRESKWFAIQLTNNQSTFNVEAGFDIAQGAGGSEVNILTNILYGWQGPLAAAGCGSFYHGGLVFPVGERLSIRIKDDNAAARNYRCIAQLWS